MAEISTTATGVQILTPFDSNVAPTLIDPRTFTFAFPMDSADFTDVSTIRGGTRFTGKQFEFWEEEG